MMLSRILVSRSGGYARRNISLTMARASGHSKWSKIKHAKGSADKARGVAFTKLIREIESAVRMGGGNVQAETNSFLSAALKRARAASLPKDNIENALKRAAGNASRQGSSVTYQAMCAGKVPLMIECMTDNANRTNGRIREVLGSHGARAADVGYMFTRVGRLVVSGPSAMEDELMVLAIESGADDFTPSPKDDDDAPAPGRQEWNITVAPEKVDEFARAVGTLSDLEVTESEVAQLCSVQAADVEDMLEKIEALVAELEEDADVVRVWTIE
ncbi:YebC-like protein [Auriculariales sp. MPI-PUGE-AT-0066]|nr:YebC-like protein [Auriculariales sp. MPI-PUGE-AT-0066]